MAATSRPLTFEAVEAIARTLPDVEVSTAYGAKALKVRGKMFACIAVNKAAEPNSLMVRMDFADRDALIAEDPGTYYLADHYAPYPCVLIRLSKVSRDALHDLVTGAYRFIAAKAPKKSTRAKASAGAVKRPSAGSIRTPRRRSSQPESG